MGHHADDVASLVHDAGNVVDGAVGVGAACIAEDDPAIVFQRLEGVSVGEIVAIMVRDGAGDHIALAHVAGEERGVVLHAQANGAADELQPRIAHQRAGQKPGLGQDLEAVAHAKNEAPAGGVRDDCLHYRRAAGDGAASQIVAVGEAAWNDHEVGACGQCGLGVPQLANLRPGAALKGPDHVILTVDAGEHDDCRLHWVVSLGVALMEAR